MSYEAQRRIGLEVRLDSGACSIPLARVDWLAGYATLTGEADDYFVGWLEFHGRQVPVFDLNRILCDRATPESFGSRIAVVATAPGAPTPHLGLLAPGMTDTVAVGAGGAAAAPMLDLDQYLPMLYLLTPEVPA